MKYLLTLVIFLLFIVPARTEEVTSADFAAGYTLEVESPGPIYGLELPPEVYQAVRRADLGDILVFNGAGEVVPHGLRDVPVAPEAARQRADIPFFPLRRDTTVAGQADLTLQVIRNSAGMVVDINGGAYQAGDKPQISEYLLDVSDLKWSAGGLEFYWQNQEDATIYTITLQHSNDLQHWTPLVAAATLVDLQHGGERVEKRTVHLTGKPQKYLRLTWQSNGLPLRLTRVLGFSQVIQSLQRRQWADLDSGVVNLVGMELIVLYQTASHLPAGSAQMHFQDNNPLARIALQSRASDKDPWRARCEQVFYTLALAASEVRNEPCTFAVTADRFWRAVVHEDGAGIGRKRQAPILQLGWTPNELVFVARGAPPFILAFGSAKMEHWQGSTENAMIRQALATAEKNQSIGTARLGKRLELGGDKALQPLPPPQPWKKWLLWAILLLGVALLAGMARSLLREMRNKAEKPTTEKA